MLMAIPIGVGCGKLLAWWDKRSYKKVMNANKPRGLSIGVIPVKNEELSVWCVKFLLKGSFTPQAIKRIEKTLAEIDFGDLNAND
jgi:hypothetical protein